jgi:hypothetical protein
MAGIVFNVALGMIPYYASLPAASDSLVLVPLEANGLESDATLRDYDTLADLLAGTSNEQTTMGRIFVTSGITDTIDDTADTREVDFPNQVWVSATGNAVGAVLVCYKPSSSATDAQIVPLTKTAFSITPAGRNIIFSTANAVFGA